MNGAIARIVLRYVVGALLAGSITVGDKLAMDPDVVMAVAAVIGIATEAFYAFAKKRGWGL